MMANTVKPIPEGYHTLTPYVVVRNAELAIDFYKCAFGATEKYRMKSPDGKLVAHAELMIGDSPLMLSDELCKESKSAETLKGSPVGFYLYVSDVDQSFKKAIDAGASEENAIADMFWGDRSGTLIDPFGNHWTIATHREDLSSEEIEKRGKEFFKKMQAA